MPNQIAPEGAIYVCNACGKRSADLYGDMWHDYGWDESCVMHAVLCDIASIKLDPDGRVLSANPVVHDATKTEHGK